MVIKKKMLKLIEYNDLILGTVVNRPSKSIKSPYLADVKINDETLLCHSPSLGCSGYVATDKKVVCVENKSKNAKSKYKIIASFNPISENYIGTDPNISNKIVFDMIKNNNIKELENMETLKSEYKINSDSRLDIYGEKYNKKYYIEIKTAPVKDEETKLAVFPKGFRKKKDESFSPRAIKHIDELIKLKNEDENNLCYLIFVIPRDDVEGFEPCKLDKLYCDKYKEGIENGIKVIVISTKFDFEEKAIVFNKFID